MDGKEGSTPEAVTLSATARLLGLSRSRVYELIKLKVFPEPSRHPTTNRPFYSREQQEQVWRIRTSGVGANGQIVFFYPKRQHGTPGASDGGADGRSNPGGGKSPETGGAKRSDSLVEELRIGLSQLGVTANAGKIRRALRSLYPDGHDDVDQSDLLRSLFLRLRCQD